MNKIAVIIPAYNEEKNLPGLIAGLNSLRAGSGLPLDFIVINDFSSDQTLALAAKLNCVVLDLSINLGIGGAVQTGLQYAREHNYDYAIQVDGDGQHPPEEIPKLLKAGSETGADVVIGSRFINNTGFQSTFFRRAGIRYFGFLLRLLCGLKITDCTSGFRIFNRRALALAAECYADEYPEPESILVFGLHGLKIAEVPVIMNPRAGGSSSIRRFGSVYYALKVSLALFFTFIRLRWKI